MLHTHGRQLAVRVRHSSDAAELDKWLSDTEYARRDGHSPALWPAARHLHLRSRTLVKHLEMIQDSKEGSL
jgi:hypothetical protein